MEHFLVIKFQASCGERSAEGKMRFLQISRFSDLSFTLDRKWDFTKEKSWKGKPQSVMAGKIICLLE